MNKRDIIFGLEKEMLKYINDDEVLSFPDEERVFHFFYKRYDYAFEDIYSMTFKSDDIPDYDDLLAELKKDRMFLKMWNRVKRLALNRAS